MIRTYRGTQHDPLLKIIIEDPTDQGYEDIVFENIRGRKVYRLEITSSGVRLRLIRKERKIGPGQVSG